MPQTTLYLRPINVVEALDKWAKVQVHIFPKRAVDIHMTTGVNGLGLDVRNVTGNFLQRSETEAFRQIVANSSTTILCTAFRISEHHQYSQGSVATIAYGLADACTGQITIDHMGDSSRIIDVMNCLAQEFVLVQRSDILFESLPQAQRDALKYQESVAAELRSQTEKIAEFNLEQLRKQNDFFGKLAAEQNEKYRLREDALSGEYRELQEKLQQRELELEAQHQIRMEEL